MLPYAREEGIITQETPDGAVVYDLHNHRAHNLNRTAALVLRHSDGQTPPAEIAVKLSSELNASVDERIIWMALDRLGQAHLLREKLDPAHRPARYSRRDMARRLGLAGGLAVLLPAVTSVLAPTPAQAATCGGAGDNCITGPSCCPPLTCQSGICA